MDSKERERLLRLGAEVELKELDKRRAELLAILGRGPAPATGKKPGRKAMSEEERKALSEKMKKKHREKQAAAAAPPAPEGKLVKGQQSGV